MSEEFYCTSKIRPIQWLKWRWRLTYLWDYIVMIVNCSHVQMHGIIHLDVQYDIDDVFVGLYSTHHVIDIILYIKVNYIMHLYMRPKLGWQYCMHDRRKKRAVYNHCIISLTLVSLLWIRKECNTSIMNITQQNCSKCNACDLVQSFACWQQSMAMRDLEQSSKPIISLSNAQSA